MRLIEEMLEEAEKANRDSYERWESGGSKAHDFMVAEEYKQIREQWFLGHFVRLYNERADVRLIFGQHLPESRTPQPDFAIYDDSGELCCYIEITEWLEPYRKRDQEYNQDYAKVKGPRLSGGLDLPSPVERLKEQLRKKGQEKAPFYPRNTWLLLDDNVGLGMYEWADKPLGDVEAASRVVDELKSELSNISQVWLLREVASPMTVHRLYPI